MQALWVLVNTGNKDSLKHYRAVVVGDADQPLPWPVQSAKDKVPLKRIFLTPGELVMPLAEKNTIVNPLEFVTQAKKA